MEAVKKSREELVSVGGLREETDNEELMLVSEIPVTMSSVCVLITAG